MFGHEHHDDKSLPEPDANLVHNDQSATAPGTSDDSAGAYIDDVPPLDNAIVTAPATTDDQADAGLGPDVSDDIITAPAAAEPSAPAEVPAAAAAVPTGDTDKLLDIKQQALQQLTPLVGHLEQSPEEKFRTTMMMIQASDNHELVPTAYEAAGQITDEKVRAQALLDIVNEINYFTHSNTEA